MSLARSLLITVVLLSVAASSYSEKPPQSSFAIVELFTSEGCSSCPPADKLFIEILDWAKKNDQKAFGLSFHVDYWNKLGWTDEFSSSAFTKRQRTYARHSGRNSLYTPQIIINGTSALSGTSPKYVKEDLLETLKQPSAFDLALELTQNTSDQISVDYKINGEISKQVINIALVEGNLANEITSGENRGMTLKHENVVRFFQTIPLKKREGTTRITLKPSYKRNDCAVIAYLQNPASQQILAAAQLPLDPQK